MSNIADICLVLEGTYPYITGGVSSWVHQLIDSLAEFTFALAVILPENEKEWQPKYDVPANVLEIKQIFLHEQKLPETHKQKLRKEAWKTSSFFTIVRLTIKNSIHWNQSFIIFLMLKPEALRL